MSPSDDGFLCHIVQESPFPSGGANEEEEKGRRTEGREVGRRRKDREVGRGKETGKGGR